MNKVRTATVIDDNAPRCGQRFVVQQWRDDVVHCWGQLVGLTGRSRLHEKSIAFAESAVEISEVDDDAAFNRELFAQAVDDHRRRGAIVVRRGRKYVVERKPFDEPFVAAAAELGLNLRTITPDEIAIVEELLGRK